MITCSIIKKSELKDAKRLDAEYYQPEYFIDFTKGDWRPIGEMLELCQYGLSQAMNDEGKGYPMFKMDNIDNGFLLDNDVRFADITKLIFDQFEIKKDDVFFNRVNSEEFVGRTGIYKLANLKSVFASYLIRARVKSDGKILADYLNIFLNSSYGLKQIRKFTRRSVNQANVNAEELKRMKIAILPMTEQEKIRDLSNRSWYEFERSKSLYSQAESLLLEGLELKDYKSKNELRSVFNLSEIKKVNRIDAEYFQPKYQKVLSIIRANHGTTLGKIVTVKKGIEPGSEAYQEEGKLFVRVSSISKDGIIGKDQKYLKNELYQKLKKDYEPKVGDILLTKDASPGMAYVVKEPLEGIISGGVLRIRLKEDIEPEYLALVINSMVGQSQVERDAGGSIISHWKPDQVKELQVPILSQSIQQKIADLVRQSHEARKKTKQLLEKAKKKVEELIEND